MNLKPTTQRMLESYTRHFIGAVLSAVMAVSALISKTPLEFSSGDWFAVANALWIAVVPVLFRWVDKYDPAFGRIVRSVAKEVDSKLAKKATSSSTKKTVKKKAV